MSERNWTDADVRDLLIRARQWLRDPVARQQTDAAENLIRDLAEVVALAWPVPLRLPPE